VVVALALLLLALAALFPRGARAGEPADDPLSDVVAEAFFLGDPLPPGGPELSLVAAGEPDERGAANLLPSLQLALRPAPRVGLTVGVAVDPSTGTASSGVHSPAGSLRVLLRSPEGGALGVATCLDLLGPGPGHEVEAGVGLGLIQAVGGLTLRTALSVASPVTGWTPRLLAGASAATALASRWRLIAETLLEFEEGELELLAGPSAKVELGPDAALAAGALVDLRNPGSTPHFVLQVSLAL